MVFETVDVIVGIVYALLILASIFFIFWIAIKRKQDAESMKKNIQSKLEQGMALTYKDILNIGKSFDLTPYQSRQVIYRVLSDLNDEVAFNKLKSLVAEIETEEPFDELPDEVKPSLVRLSKIAKSTNEESDQYILTPVVQTLNKYVDMKSEQEKFKKQTQRSIVVSVVSVVIGVLSFFGAPKPPSAVEIANEINTIQINRLEKDRQME